MNLTLVLDVGSTHLGDLDNMKRHIDRAAGLPVYVKAQLFELEQAGPNRFLPFDVYAKAWEYACKCNVRLFASVFSPALGYLLSNLDRRLCKLAYSKRHLINEPWDHTSQIHPLRASFDKWMISYPLTEACIGEADNVDRLLCINEYPVWHAPRLNLIDWSVWDGWSSHTLGWDVEEGLVAHLNSAGRESFIIEKHVRLDDRNSCPDATFAVSWESVVEFINKMKGIHVE